MHFRQNFDLSVYFVADPSLCNGRPIADIVAAAVKGGATIVQLRNKEDKLSVIEKQARELLPITRAANVPLLINDYMDVAFNTGADGVHLGQGDTAPADARKVLGPDVIIGLTAFAPEHFAVIDPEIVDYTGTGPFYPTKTDKGKPVLGAEKFAALVALSSVPVVGIGGITPDNAAPVIEAGAQGVAMMRSISGAADPEAEARRFAKIVSSIRLKEAS
jgi:thiamine-phosphate pyrophosphorylase